MELCAPVSPTRSVTSDTANRSRSLHPDYPQSNGKIERWHKTIKGDAIRPGQPATIDEARALVARYVEHYNTVRLHSAIGYITPADFLAGRAQAIFAERDRKLEAAREVRRVRREELRQQEA